MYKIKQCSPVSCFGTLSVSMLPKGSTRSQLVAHIYLFADDTNITIAGNYKGDIERIIIH